MKEVTKWNNNPRMMWAWNNIIGQKEKVKVIYIMEGDVSSPVIALNKTQCYPVLYSHCAEIEEPKKRRMTNQELAWWLQDGIKEGKHREYKFPNTKTQIVRTTFDYEEEIASEEIYDNIRIRENGGEWHEPLVEVEE